MLGVNIEQYGMQTKARLTLNAAAHGRQVDGRSKRMENLEEEVMKALKFKAQHDAKIAYIDGAACKHIRVEQILEYVEKLQAENERLTEENGQLKAYNNGLEYENAELQKQVDELTERYLEESKERLEFEQRYKKIQHAHNIGLGAQRSQWEKKVQQAVKDTAKAIISDMFKEIEGYERIDRVLEQIAKRYGVGVE